MREGVIEEVFGEVVPDLVVPQLDGFHARDEWGKGPWNEEPDKVEWRDPKTGMPCLIVRGPMGALCGYVAVEPGHPLHGVPYSGRSDVHGEPLGPEPDGMLRVHGGLTFSDRCHEGGRICHVPKPGESEDAWWFGFDCGHSDDVTPGMSNYSYEYSSYKDLAYVRSQVESLASQLKEVGNAAQ